MSDLPRALHLICDDFFFATLAAEAVDEGVWDEVAKARANAYAEAGRGGVFASALEGDVGRWGLGLVREASAWAPPAWMPMHELIASGVTLLGGARGVRGLFGARPSEQEVLRTKRLGALAYRVLSAVVAADGEASHDERLMLQAMLSSLGLPPAEETALASAAPVEAGAIEVLGDVDARTAALIVRGAWQAALRDGLDAREEGALGRISAALSLRPEDATAQRSAAEAAIEASRRLGRSTIDILFWLLGDDTATAQAAGSTVATLALPSPERSTVLLSLAKGAPPADVNRASLAKPARAAALGLAWLMALRTDPSLTRKASLAGRLDTIARALDADGSRVRQLADEAVARRLAAVVTATEAPRS